MPIRICLYVYKYVYIYTYLLYAYLYIYTYICIYLYIYVQPLQIHTLMYACLVFASDPPAPSLRQVAHECSRNIGCFQTSFLSSTLQLPVQTPQLPSNRDHKAFNRGALGGLGCFKLLFTACAHDFARMDQTTLLWNKFLRASGCGVRVYPRFWRRLKRLGLAPVLGFTFRWRKTSPAHSPRQPFISCVFRSRTEA